MSNLVIIRGNSGSGKSTIAKSLRERLRSKKVALIEQDYLRRHILGESGKKGDDNIELIELAVRFALEKNYKVILEGIMPTEYYGDMLKRLVAINPSSAVVVYLDVPLDETLKRHETKPNRSDFGEIEMRDWYREKDYLRTKGELIISENSDIDASVQLIADRFSFNTAQGA